MILACDLCEACQFYFMSCILLIVKIDYFQKFVQNQKFYYFSSDSSLKSDMKFALVVVILIFGFSKSEKYFE